MFYTPWLAYKVYLEKGPFFTALSSLMKAPLMNFVSAERPDQYWVPG
jgi:hypothetical protein